MFRRTLISFQRRKVIFRTSKAPSWLWPGHTITCYTLFRLTCTETSHCWWQMVLQRLNTLSIEVNGLITSTSIFVACCQLTHNYYTKPAENMSTSDRLKPLQKVLTDCNVWLVCGKTMTNNSDRFLRQLHGPLNITQLCATRRQLSKSCSQTNKTVNWQSLHFSYCRHI